MGANLQFTIEVSGIGPIQRRLVWTPENATAVAIGLLKSGRIMLDDSRPNVPVLTGNLQSTGKIKGPISTQFGFGQRVEVEYGGGTSLESAGGFPDPGQLPVGGRVNYAAEQHERNPRKAKFLENAFIREASNTVGRVADELFLVLGRNVRRS